MNRTIIFALAIGTALAIIAAARPKKSCTVIESKTHRGVEYTIEQCETVEGVIYGAFTPYGSAFFNDQATAGEWARTEIDKFVQA